MGPREVAPRQAPLVCLDWPSKPTGSCDPFITAARRPIRAQVLRDPTWRDPIESDQANLSPQRRRAENTDVASQPHRGREGAATPREGRRTHEPREISEGLYGRCS